MANDDVVVDEEEEVEEDAEPTGDIGVIDIEEIDEVAEVLETELDDEFAEDESDEASLIGFGFRLDDEGETSNDEEDF